MLRRYSGPRLELGMAEQFVLLLSDMPDYGVLLEGHLMQAEFKKTTLQFQASLQSLIDMAKLVLECGELQQVLQCILAVGNYLNYVSICIDISVSDYLVRTRKVHLSYGLDE